MATVDKEETERKARAWAGEGFNADFEELVTARIASLLKMGVKKEHVITMLDVLIQALLAAAVERHHDQP